jgi:hypothetical protein
MHNQDIEHELRAMSQKLEDYLLGNDLYKTITVHTPGGERLIKMTIGGMLERLDTLKRHNESSTVIQEADETLARAERTYPEPFYSKLAREAKSYTDSWNWFLQNCWEGESRCATDYALEVPLRLRIERLLDAAGEHPELADTRRRVRDLDRRLRAIWQPSDQAVIDESDAYPREHYWWLFGRPQPTG